MMEKNSKTPFNLLCVSCLFFLLMISIRNFAQENYTTKGTDFINRETGERVILRGFGLGCWLLPEGYMWGIRKIDRPWQFEKAIKELIGEEDAKEFWRLFYENYVTEADIAAMKSWGINSLRIPILAAVLQPREGQPEKPPYIYSDYGFGLLDNLVKWCKKYGVGIIWDLHGAPGYQNAENISDSDGEAKLWTQKEKYWPMCTDLWYKIAERYKNEPNIIGYDLLNEPLLIRYKGIDPRLLRDLYVILTDTIRRVDKEGIIFIEGDDWAQNFDYLEPMNWDRHLAMSFHSYPPTSNAEGLKRWDALRQKYNIPLWHGETGEQGPPYKLNVEATRFLESANVSWNWWTHKKFDLQSQPWSIVRSPGFLKILDYWNGFGEKPSKEKAKKWLFEQAKATNTNYCQFNSDMVRSLVPLNPDDYVKSREVIKPQIVTQPENLSVEEGGIVRTMVRALGYPLNYQWLKNGIEITGQTKQFLYITNPSKEDNKNTYSVKISNSKGTVESDKIKLTVTSFTGAEIKKATVAPVIDGKIDTAWEKIQWIEIKNLIMGRINSEADLSAKAKILWDEKNLYLFIDVNDDILSKATEKNYLTDEVEIFLDVNNYKSQIYDKTQYQFRFGRNSTNCEILQGELNGEITVKQVNEQGNYKMELSIPWKAVKYIPSENKLIGIDIHVIDNDNERRSTKIAWSGKQDLARRTPMVFGTMKLTAN